MSSSLQKYKYCFVAGCFAAGGSFFGKMPSVLKEHNAEEFIGIHLLPEDLQFYGELLLIKCLPIAIMILCNILNWRYFLKALQKSEQTLTVTVLTTASNYIVSFLLACCIYKEPITLCSSVGAVLIIIGLYFLCDNGEEANLKISNPINKKTI